MSLLLLVMIIINIHSSSLGELANETSNII